MDGQGGMVTLLRIGANLKALENDRQEYEKQLKKYVKTVIGILEKKYDTNARMYDQTFGGRETGRIESHLEVNLSDLSVRMDFSPTEQKGEIEYGRHLNTESNFELSEILGIVPILHDCAKKIGLQATIMQSDYRSGAKPAALTFGGKYNAENIEDVGKFVITVDNLLDFYVGKIEKKDD